MQHYRSDLGVDWMIVSLAANSGGLKLPTVHRKLRWRTSTWQGLCTMPLVFDHKIPTLFPTLFTVPKLWLYTQNFYFSLKVSARFTKSKLRLQCQNLDFNLEMETFSWSLVALILSRRSHTTAEVRTEGKGGHLSFSPSHYHSSIW